MPPAQGGYFFIPVAIPTVGMFSKLFMAVKGELFGVKRPKGKVLADIQNYRTTKD